MDHPQPPPADLAAAIDVLVQAIGRSLADRPQLRAAVHHLAVRLAELSAPPAAPPEAPAVARAPEPAPPEPVAMHAVVEAPAPAAAPALDVAEALRLLQTGLGRHAVSGATVPPAQRAPEAASQPPAEPADLSMVAKRCRLKAEACRFAISPARARGAPGAQEQDIQARAARLDRCSLWMLGSPDALPGHRAVEQIAGCYENTGAAAELTSDIVRDETRIADLLPDSMALLAEAQSSLRLAVAAAAIHHEQDQEDAFYWLRDRTTRDRIYIGRHMRLDDGADPAGHENLRERINQIRAAFEADRQRRRGEANLRSKVRYHAKRLQDRRADNPADDWRTLLRAVRDLVEMGVPPSDPGLRDTLLPVYQGLPPEAEIPGPAARVLEEIGDFLQSRATANTPADEPRPQPEEVRRAASLLSDRVVLLIGGEERPQTARQLESDLRLRELRWLCRRPHSSTAPFEPEIGRADVDLVLFLTRFSNTNDGPEVRAMCKKHGKLCVMLPAGYGAPQIAHQVLEQASGRLLAR